MPQHLTVQLASRRTSRFFSSCRAARASCSSRGLGAELVSSTRARISSRRRSAKNAVSDTQSLGPPSRAAGRTQPAGRNRQTAARGRGSDSPTFGFNQRGYLLIYASQEPLPYTTLSSTRVSGISVPIEDNDALNTVTKLIRQTTQDHGPWAAFATDYPP